MLLLLTVLLLMKVHNLSKVVTNFYSVMKTFKILPLLIKAFESFCLVCILYLTE